MARVGKIWMLIAFALIGAMGCAASDGDDATEQSGAPATAIAEEETVAESTDICRRGWCRESGNGPCTLVEIQSGWCKDAPAMPSDAQ